jgi:NRPS condensation-like uncharacterized protein
VSAGATLALNRSERTYWAIEGVSGSITQLVMLRFASPVSVESIRAALRRVVRAFPRMRTIVEPTLFSYRLRVLADEEIEALFEDAFRVAPHVATDLPSIEQYATELLNEPFALERGLPIRARFLPDAKEPTLLFMLHHVICDGRSWMMAAEALVRTLNGMPIEDVPLDPPSMVPALLPTSWGARVSSLWRSFFLDRSEKARLRSHRMLRFGKRSPRFGPVGVCIRRLPVSMADLKRASKARGCTVTALVVAALAETFGHGAVEDGKNAVGIRLSVDLRKYYPKGQSPAFGNYVATFAVLATAFDIRRALTSVSEQLREGLDRFERKSMSYPLLLAELLTLVGRKLLALAVLSSKRKGTIAPLTCHYSSLGSVDALNAEGAHTKLCDVVAITPNVHPFVVTAGLGDRLVLAFSYERNEVTQAEAYALLDRLGEAMRVIALEATPLPTAVTEARIAV